MKSFLPNLGKFLKNHLAANLTLNVIWVRGLGKMAPGKGMLNWSDKVRLGKVM